MTRVKICGIQQPEHALVAARAGADYIGLVFVPERRRRVDIATAKQIVTALKNLDGEASKVVGLFADQPADEVNQVVQACALDLVQLCGHESLDYCQQMQAQVIKVIHVPPTANTAHPEPAELPYPAHPELVEGSNPARGEPVEPPDPVRPEPVEGQSYSLSQTIQKFTKAGHLVTLDRLVEGLQGGTGQSFDWKIAAQLASSGHDFVLAGGLTPDNVSDAVAQVRPWGVDVSSGVETSGVKDPQKIREFVERARAVERNEDRSRHPG